MNSHPRTTRQPTSPDHEACLNGHFSTDLNDQCSEHAAGPLGLPPASGLYDPANERDSCGVGFVAHIKGQPSHDIVRDALTMLTRMDHRGACGCEANTGDGAGILTALPHAFFQKVAAELGFTLPEPGRYAVGMVFLPRDEAVREECRQIMARFIDRQGQKLLGWRVVMTDADAADVGPTARSTEPHVEQVFIAAQGSAANDPLEFERQLYTIRKQAYHWIKGTATPTPADARAAEPAPSQSPKWREATAMYYVCSLSSRIIVYKGQLTSEQVPLYYPDLRDPDYVSHLAMVHSRFSTNTFPSWDRAQPMRWMSHNGEINTVRGNVNWMTARQGLLQSELMGENLHRLMPVIDPFTSDSGMFDNTLELLVLAGRSLPEAIMMMIPEAWENHEAMPMAKRAFYEYHANLMEPWDGPASVSFTDGQCIGACLDRNGLRPSRYYVTHDDRVIMASEVGVVDVPPQQVREKGRLQPGKMFLVDFEQGRIIADEELKQNIASKRPYAQWLQAQRIDLADFSRSQSDREPSSPGPDLLPRLAAFGYTTEHLNMLMLPMVRKGEEAMGSMGNDAALAVLSDKPRLIYDYFKQLFAQVTNPPIDPIREAIIMSLATSIGPEGNLLGTTETQCQRLHLPQPILTDQQIAAIKATETEPAAAGGSPWRAKTIDITYPCPEGEDSCRDAMVAALDRICAEASQAIEQGYPLIVLSDRATGPERLPLSSLLATGAVHHHLVRHLQRTRIGILVESGEAREVHHFCLLAGFGADAVNPYLALAGLRWMREQGVIDAGIDDARLVERFIKAINKGMLKVMSKMGISTLASYKGAQIFEILGLRAEVVDRCFVGTASRLQGAGFDVLAKESLRRHRLGYPRREQVRPAQLPNPGDYHWRPDGEAHAFSPKSIAALQVAARNNSRQAYEQYARMCNEDAESRATLRGLLKLKAERPCDAGRTDPIPLDEVEPAGEIVKRFRTGAMSFGALSIEAHETLALAMNRIGGQSNSGEGGEDAARFQLQQYDDGTPRSKRSAIKQIASGRFGVTSFYLANADTLQIKMAQGAKPGEGGQLPGHKVSPEIAKVRYSTPGVGLISPPPHHDIYSIEDLAQLIFDLKNSNPAAQVSVKLVAEVGVGTVATGVAKAFADHILISGHDGGTGASPLTSIKHAGLPWELGIAEAHQTLVLNDLRSRIRLETDGGMKTGRDIVIAACLGAEEYGFSTAPLVTVGCIMMRKCHLNTCPVGVCTQDPVLRKKFTGQPEHVINYLFMVAEEARGYMAKMGVRTFDELIGRVDLLQADRAIAHWKADGLDLTPILTPAKKPRPDTAVRKSVEQGHKIDDVLDRTLIVQCRPRITNESQQPVELEHPIRNTDRAVGTMLSHEISRCVGEQGLPDDTIRIRLRGSAGQSLGAFLARGITLELEGDANDYVGKGLSGGKIVVYPPKDSSFVPEESILVGNVCLYGATGGEAYFRGVAAERFAVRNSGAHAVVEGVGDHGCEYMTGGRVVVLGKTGRNFAAGMSGGIAYVWDRDGEFLAHCNLGMVDLEKLDEDDADQVQSMLRKHCAATGSTVAAVILDQWPRHRSQFVKVMPIDYRKVLDQQKQRITTEEVSDVGLG